MTPPFGFVEEGKEHKFCKSLKYFYGLKQSLIAWYEKNDSYVKDWGLSYSDVDHNLQYRKSYDKIVVLILCVDDSLLTRDHEKKINWSKE
jgi:hypothetical protein